MTDWTAIAVLALALGATGATAQPQPPAPAVDSGVVDLACTGTARYPARGGATVSARNGDVDIRQRGSTATQETFVFRIDGDAIHVRQPVATADYLRGKDLPGGWRPMKDVRITEDRITGRFVFNTLNHVDIDIDRRTGEAEARAIGFHFRGACDAARIDPAGRKF